MNKELNELIVERLESLKEYCTSRGQMDTIYETAKTILIEIKNAPFKEKYLTYFKQGKTLLLREICKEVGFDYWKDLKTSNAIDRLDSISLQIRCKKNGIHY